MPHLRQWCARVLLAVPVLAFIVLLLRTPLNVPVEDDYLVLFRFLRQYRELPTSAAKLDMVLFQQYAQYKLIMLKCIVLLQFWAIGHLNLPFLELLGDLSVFALAILLYRLYLRLDRPVGERLWLFVPACALIFMPQYAQTLNWASSGLQNLLILPLAILALITFERPGPRSTIVSYVALVLSVLTSGSGLIVALVAAVVLATQRRWQRLAGWLIVSASVSALYFTKYHPETPYPNFPLKHPGVIRTLFPFGFLGGALVDYHLAIPFGILLVVLFLILLRKGWLRADPSSCAIAVFCILAAIIASEGRWRFGLTVSTSGRYRVYCQLLVVVLYFGVLRLYAPKLLAASQRWRLAIGTLTAASLFCCLASDRVAYRELTARNQLATAHLILWERHPETTLNTPDITYAPPYIRRFFAEEFQMAITAGVYTPPGKATDPLPVAPIADATIARDHLQVAAADLTPP